MIGLKTFLRCIDNTGALMVECITVLGKDSFSHARVGDKIVCVVKKVKPASAGSNNLVKKGEVCHGIVLRTKQTSRARANGIRVQFNDNAIALINKNNGEPLGQRYLRNSNIVAKEVQRRFPKIAAVTEKRI